MFGLHSITAGHTADARGWRGASRTAVVTVSGHGMQTRRRAERNSITPTSMAEA